MEQDFSDVHYFPSYEIMMDDLRDYRFYQSDLIHPNEQAEQYIFEKFGETYFTEDLNAFLKEWNKVKMSLNHRPNTNRYTSSSKILSRFISKIRWFQS